MGRYLPTECEHGRTLDHGDFGDEWSPYADLCPDCMPMSTVERLTVEYRANNRHWLEEYHRDYYRMLDEEGPA